MGNSCEFKNCILFDEAQVPHFNYVGDSILGYRAHLGAGVILSNVKLDHAEIHVSATDGDIATGLTKVWRDHRRSDGDWLQRGHSIPARSWAAIASFILEQISAVCSRDASIVKFRQKPQVLTSAPA